MAISCRAAKGTLQATCLMGVDSPVSILNSTKLVSPSPLHPVRICHDTVLVHYTLGSSLPSIVIVDGTETVFAILVFPIWTFI